MPEKTLWEKQMEDAIELALKACQGVGKEYKLIVFEIVLRKALEIKYP